MTPSSLGGQECLSEVRRGEAVCSGRLVLLLCIALSTKFLPPTPTCRVFDHPLTSYQRGLSSLSIVCPFIPFVIVHFFVLHRFHDIHQTL